jgi:hypothetical protein
MKFVELTEGTGIPGASGKRVLVNLAHVVKVAPSPAMTTPRTTNLELVNAQSLTVVGDYDAIRQLIQTP